MSIMSYGLAINDAHRIMLKKYEECFVIGQGVSNPWFVGKTTVGLVDEFSDRRVMDTPVCEAAMAGAAIGAAMAGMKPIVFFPRMDFMYLSLDQIINHCASWNYMFNGQVNVPVVIRGIVNRGGEQGAQHSQSPLAMYANVPGLKVVCPATPSDAKGLLIAAVEDKDPVIFIDDRWLYDLEEDVAEGYYSTPIGKANILKAGSDVTIISASYMVKPSMEAAKELEQLGISCEVVDLRTVKPLDEETVLASTAKTKRVVIAVAEWDFASVSSHVAQIIYKEQYSTLKHAIEKVNLPNVPAPASRSLEEVYYPDKNSIVSAVKRTME